MQLDIVILAAGVGKRMRSSLPKVLHPLAGKPLLSHVLDTARALSPSRICVVYGHGGELVPQSFNDPSLVWIKQERQLGTGHALKQSLPYLAKTGKTLVLFGDVPLVKSTTLERLIERAIDGRLVLLTTELEDPSGYGRIVRDQKTGYILSIVEEKDATPSEKSIREINTGIMVFPNEQLPYWLADLNNVNAQGEYYLTDVVAMAVSTGIRIDAAYSTNSWETVGVNNKLQLAALERVFQRNQADNLLEQGVMLADPSRIDIRGQLVCGENVEIDVGCIFEGEVRLGDNVKIEANCILRNAVIDSGTVVSPYSLIDEAKVGINCRIGPFARIRPGTNLDNAVHIGNFVEIKNSHISSSSKANHLSYIGDTVIGKHVNIGAGTITCNYDGAMKHKTIIEDNVFIGSDTQLIAPVKVSKGSTIGAGSTITRDTPEGQLTLSRSKQTTIVNWKRPIKDQD